MFALGVVACDSMPRPQVTKLSRFISHKAFVLFSACFIIFPSFFVSFPICKKLQEQAPQAPSPAAVLVRSYHILFVVRRRCPSVGTTLQGLGLTRLPDVKVLELNLEGGSDKMVPSILHQLRLVVYPIIYRVWDTSQVVFWDVFHQNWWN